MGQIINRVYVHCSNNSILTAIIKSPSHQHTVPRTVARRILETTQHMSWSLKSHHTTQINVNTSVSENSHCVLYWTFTRLSMWWLGACTGGHTMTWWAKEKWLENKTFLTKQDLESIPYCAPVFDWFEIYKGYSAPFWFHRKTQSIHSLWYNCLLICRTHITTLIELWTFAQALFFFIWIFYFKSLKFFSTYIQ